MTTKHIELTEAAFDAAFPLVINHLNPKAAWKYDEGPGYLFEPHGGELEFVRRQEPATVWTYFADDQDHRYVVSGLRADRCIGYLVSASPLPPGVEVRVRVAIAYRGE